MRRLRSTNDFEAGWILFCSILGLIGTLLHAFLDFPLQIRVIQLYFCVLLGISWSARRAGPEEEPTESIQKENLSCPRRDLITRSIPADFEVFLKDPPAFLSQGLMLESGQRTEPNGRGKILERSKRATGMKPGGNNDCVFTPLLLSREQVNSAFSLVLWLLGSS